ncbi:MAG: hypothetical protein ACR2RA_23835 [Geminicoccaceae bacterium]
MKPIIRTPILILALSFFGCAQPENPSTSLYEDLAMFVSSGAIKSEEMRLFFADEAVKAGVVEIRAMRQEEKRTKKSHQAQTGCGRAIQETREILIDADRPSCISLTNLAHEIAHFPAKDQGCRGHGDLFYEINEEIAQRFQGRFPGESWGGSSPVGKVRSRSIEYRSSC